VAAVEDVKVHIAASVDEVERSIVGMRGAVERLDEALVRLRITTAGSLHPRAAEAIVRFEEAKQRLEEAQVLALSGVAAAQAYHSII
jgi:hypothetical protein